MRPGNSHPRTLPKFAGFPRDGSRGGRGTKDGGANSGRGYSAPDVGVSRVKSQV